MDDHYLAGYRLIDEPVLTNSGLTLGEIQPNSKYRRTQNTRDVSRELLRGLQHLCIIEICK